MSPGSCRVPGQTGDPVAEMRTQQRAGRSWVWAGESSVPLTFGGWGLKRGSSLERDSGELRRGKPEENGVEGAREVS